MNVDESTGAHGKELQLGALFGSTADRILRQSPCPILVVRSLNHCGNGLSHAEVMVAQYESVGSEILPSSIPRPI